MKIYASSGVTEVTVPLPDGGQHRHTRPKGQTGPFELDCGICAPLLLEREAYHPTLERNGQQFDWTPSRDLVPRTPAEDREEEELQRSAFSMQQEDWEAFQEFKKMRRSQQGKAIRL